MTDRLKCIKPDFQLGLLPVALITEDLLEAIRRKISCAARELESVNSLIKLCSSENHCTQPIFRTKDVLLDRIKDKCLFCYSNLVVNSCFLICNHHKYNI